MILAAKQPKTTKAWGTTEPNVARKLLAERSRSRGKLNGAESTTGYLRELYRRELLSPAEEVVLFKWLDELKEQSSSIQSLPSDLRNEESAQDLAAIEREIIVVRNHLVESNLRLVVAAARKFRGPGDTDFHDLICEGNAILLKAVDLFKVEFGYRFSTYAMTALNRGFFNFIQREQRRSNRFKSGQEEPFDGLEDTSSPEELSMEALHDVTRLLKELDDREHEIIVARFGLVAGEKGKTYRELGEKLNLSKERIRQISNKALEKMREKIERLRTPAPIRG